MALLRADDRAVMFQDQSKRTFNSMLAYDCPSYIRRDDLFLCVLLLQLSLPRRACGPPT